MENVNLNWTIEVSSDEEKRVIHFYDLCLWNEISLLLFFYYQEFHLSLRKIHTVNFKQLLLRWALNYYHYFALERQKHNINFIFSYKCPIKTWKTIHTSCRSKWIFFFNFTLLLDLLHHTSFLSPLYSTSFLCREYLSHRLHCSRKNFYFRKSVSNHQ